MTFRFISAIMLAGALLLPAGEASAQGSSTMQTVKQRGQLRCGASQGVAGFSLPDQAGKWSGFDVDMCRALAAAIFNDPEKAQYVSLSAKDRFTALQSGDIDVLTRTTTWTLSRDAGLGLNFTAINYFDGQTFMVPKKRNVAAVKDLVGATICTTQGTTNELNLADYFRTRGLKYEPVVFQTNDEASAAYAAGRCDAFTSDASQLVAIRLKLPNPDDHMLLGELISKEPLGTWVRQGDDQWFDLVRWTFFAMVNAEELGVTQKNLDQMLSSPNPEIRRLLGVEGAFGDNLGLTKDWVVRIVRAVGNYGESYERHLGAASPLKLPRGLNALWRDGGGQYAPPIR